MARTYRVKRKTTKRVRDGYPQYVTASCGHNNWCPWCRNNRTHSSRRRDTSGIQDNL